MMTGTDGINQDLDNILEEAGNPRWLGWVGTARAYAAPEGGIMLLFTEEDEVSVLSYQWVKGDQILVSEERSPRAVVEEQLGIPYKKAKHMADRILLQERRDNPANSIMRGLGYNERTHPGLL